MCDENILIAYYRISSEDKNLKNSSKAVSNSIANQRLLIREYINSKDDLRNCTIIEKLDDGCSGTNFERPAIKEALELLKQRKAKGIIVKDLSRFGRNYIDVGNYLEQVFPFLGIRFIAVNDGYDSSDPNCVGSMETIFKTMFAGLYSKDLSVKVKSAQRRLAQQGKFINPFAPYGYIKSPNNSKTLDIDEEAAAVVKWIFHAFLNGTNKSEIARELNEQFVLTPMLYKDKAGCSRSWANCACNEINYWTDTSVHVILTDKRYMGTVVYGKSRKAAVGSHQFIRNPKSEWIVVEDMHDGIVSEYIFKQAQALIREIENPTATQCRKTLLDSKMKCASCNRTLTLVRSKVQSYYYCQTRRFTTAFACDSVKLYVEDVRNAILQSIRLQAEFAVNAEEILKLKYQGHKAELQAKQDEIRRCKTGIDRFSIRQKELFETYFAGQLEKQLYMCENKLCADKRGQLEEKLRLLQEELKVMQADTELGNPFIKAIKPYLFIEELDDDVVGDLIDEVCAFEDNTIEIDWKFKDEIALLLQMITP